MKKNDPLINESKLECLNNYSSICPSRGAKNEMKNSFEKFIQRVYSNLLIRLTETFSHWETEWTRLSYECSNSDRRGSQISISPPSPSPFNRGGEFEGDHLPSESWKVVCIVRRVMRPTRGGDRMEGMRTLLRGGWRGGFQGHSSIDAHARRFHSLSPSAFQHFTRPNASAPAAKFFDNQSFGQILLLLLYFHLKVKSKILKWPLQKCTFWIPIKPI